MFLLSYEGIKDYILTLKNNKGDPHVFVVDIYTHTDKEIVKANGLLFELLTALKIHGHMLQGLFLHIFDCSRINADILAQLITRTASITLSEITPDQLSVIKSAIHPDLSWFQLQRGDKSAIEDIQEKVAANEQAAKGLAAKIIDQEFAATVTDIGLVDKLLERPHAVTETLLRQGCHSDIAKQFQQLLLPACLYAKALHKAKEEHAQLTAQDSSLDDEKNDDDSAQQIVFNFPDLFKHIQAEAGRVGIKTAEQFQEMITNLATSSLDSLILAQQDTATDDSGANDELQAGDSGYCSSDDATLDAASAVLIGEADFS